MERGPQKSMDSDPDRIAEEPKSLPMPAVGSSKARFYLLFVCKRCSSRLYSGVLRTFASVGSDRISSKFS